MGVGKGEKRILRARGTVKERRRGRKAAFMRLLIPLLVMARDECMWVEGARWNTWRGMSRSDAAGGI